MRSKLQCLARIASFHPSPLEHTERASLASGPWTLVLHGVHPLYNLALSSDLLVLPSAGQMHQSWPEVFGTSSRVGAVRFSGSVRWQGFLLEEKLVAGIKTSSVLLPQACFSWTLGGTIAWLSLVGPLRSFLEHAPHPTSC